MQNPTNRYETVLTRRSVRKHTNGVQSDAEEERGDVSLGLKIKIIAGKAIIQQVKPELIDGSTSPAAASSRGRPDRGIQRGDVILSLNGQCLVAPNNVEGTEMVTDRLGKSILFPNEDGVYSKKVHMELARGEGMALLERWEAAEEKQARNSYNVPTTTTTTTSTTKPSRLSFLRRGSSATAAASENPMEEGYATLGGGFDNLPDNNNPKKKGGNKAAKAAAVAGIAGLVLMGPMTAVAAAGGAALVVAKKKQNQNNSNN